MLQTTTRRLLLRRRRACVVAVSFRTKEVYTRTGDEGATSLFTGHRVAKTSPILDALGDTDELNAHLGIACFECRQEGRDALGDRLALLQSALFDVGSSIATPVSQIKEAGLGWARLCGCEQSMAGLSWAGLAPFGY
jgi:cob(I)alamin adenosyltransferase